MSKKSFQIIYFSATEVTKTYVDFIKEQLEELNSTVCRG